MGTHSLRDLASIRVAQPLYQLSQLARAGTRPGARAYAEGLSFRARAAGWSDERVRGWVLDRLRFSVRRAARETSYYRERFASIGFDPRADFSFEDFARLPVLERDAMRDRGDEMVSQAVPPALLRRDATGGSTGTPTVLWKGPEELGWGRSGVEHFMRLLSLPMGARIGLLWGHHLDPVARSSVRDHLVDWLHNNRWYDCFRLSPDVLLGYHEELRRWRPAAMICYAGALAALADAVAAAGGGPPGYPTVAFITGAEKLYAHQRALVERTFGVPALERYGSRDVGLIGFQLPARDWRPGGAPPPFVIDWATVLVEPDTTVPAGTPAGVLVTKLHADGMPMLRYRIGDLAVFPGDAPSGAPARTLLEVVGRDVDRIWLPGGGWFNSLSFPHLLKDFPVRDFQVRQAADFSVEIHIVPADGYDESHGSAIVSTVAPNLGGIPIRIRRVDAIARTKANKWRPVISEVTAEQAASSVGVTG